MGLRTTVFPETHSPIIAILTRGGLQPPVFVGTRTTLETAQLNTTAGTPEAGQASSDLEERLAAAIEPWLAHMRWRKDFDEWRQRRIWQENHQSANVRDVRQALGEHFDGKFLLDLGAGMG